RRGGPPRLRPCAAGRWWCRSPLAPCLLGCRLPRAPSEDDALEEAVAHHSIATVRAAGDLAAREHARERRLRARVDHEAAVLVVEDGVGEDALFERIDAGAAVAPQHVRQRDLRV